MMANPLSFEILSKRFNHAIDESMKEKSIEPVRKLYDSLSESVTEKRAVVDQGFRERVVLMLGKPKETEDWKNLLTRCIEACQRDMASVTLPVVLLGDIFDCLTLNQCEKLFTFVEDNVSIWKEDLFFTACKNNLLRMCNDLLRRLSRSQNTVFCGRILLFLAKFFPFSERSGLNIVSEFNIENITEFSAEDSEPIGKEDDTKDETMEEDDLKIKIDYNLYTKFWALQNFFRNPLLIYNKSNYSTFVNNTEDVLQVFKSFKLEGLQTKLVSADSMVTETIGREHYFAKYLTNIKLLELQLSDVNFRRYVLVQFLILFQYLNATVKFKSENQELKPQEAEWVKDTTEKVYGLIKETPPDGVKFAESMQNILKREDFWNNWKNDGCPELQKPTPVPDEGDEDRKHNIRTQRQRSRKRAGDIVKESAAQKKFYMGHPELTKLWNYNSDNLAACRAPNRNFCMSLEEYFKEAIEQLDPAAMVEDQYKVVNDGNFGWRALRLLALQSSHFFTHSNNPINKLPEYLETMIKKIAKERPIILPSGEIKSQEGLEAPESNTVEVNETEAEPEAEEEDELLKGDEKRDDMNNEENSPKTPEASPKPSIAPEIFDVVAQTINNQWQILAEKMDYKDSIQYIEQSTKTDVERARYVLQLWFEENTHQGPLDLVKTLDSHGFPKAASVVTKLM